jgi:hypothetical protein
MRDVIRTELATIVPLDALEREHLTDALNLGNSKRSVQGRARQVYISPSMRSARWQPEHADRIQSTPVRSRYSVGRRVRPLWAHNLVSPIG